MQTNISNVPIKPIKTKSGEKYSARFLSREMSVSNSSSEVYYGDASVAIPFTWESQPGTPKIKFLERPLPPLTPPPSYLCSPAKKYVKKDSRSGILHNVFPKLNTRKNQLLSPPASSPSLSWSSSSSSSSSPWSSLHSVPSSPFTQRSSQKEKISSTVLLFDSRAEEADYESPVSTLCFGTTGRSSNVRSRGYSAKVIKLLLGESM